VWIAFWAIFVLPYVAIWVSIVVCCIGSFFFFQMDRISVAKPVRDATQRTGRTTAKAIDHFFGVRAPDGILGSAPLKYPSIMVE
jgi:hypothetical protein